MGLPYSKMGALEASLIFIKQTMLKGGDVNHVTLTYARHACRM